MTNEEFLPSLHVQEGYSDCGVCVHAHRSLCFARGHTGCSDPAASISCVCVGCSHPISIFGFSHLWVENIHKVGMCTQIPPHSLNTSTDFAFVIIGSRSMPGGHHADTTRCTDSILTQGFGVLRGTGNSLLAAVQPSVLGSNRGGQLVPGYAALVSSRPGHC